MSQSDRVHFRQTVVAEVEAITFKDIVAKVEPHVVLINVRSEETGSLLIGRTRMRARAWGEGLRSGDRVSFEATLIPADGAISLRNPRKLQVRSAGSFCL